MRTDAFRELIRVLQNVPANEHFDMHWWQNLRLGKACRCAIGWAADDPWFNKQGLLLVAKDHSTESQVWFGHNYGFTAVAEFFDITRREAEELFMAHDVDTGNPQQVIDRIRNFVKRKQRFAGEVE